MMILGFIITAVIAGKQLEPFSFERLVMVTGSVSIIAFVVTVVAVWGVESSVKTPVNSDRSPVDYVEQDVEKTAEPGGYKVALKNVWDEPDSRRFSVFVFISMLAYSAQDLILEPFAGAVFGMTPGQSTQLSGTQHGGVLVGMLMVALMTSIVGGKIFGSLRHWTMGGCIASACCLLLLAIGGQFSSVFPLKAMVFALGLSNGIFAVAAIGSMMDLVGRGARQREGVRMGMWGAAQAIAFGLGGVAATMAVDISRMATGDAAMAYGIVFAVQAVLFVWAAGLARGVYQPAPEETTGEFSPGRIALEMEG